MPKNKIKQEQSKTTPRNIILKLQKMKDKVWREARGKQHLQRKKDNYF